MVWPFALRRLMGKNRGLMLVCCLLLSGCGSTSEEPLAQITAKQSPTVTSPLSTPELSYSWGKNKSYLYTLKQTIYQGEELVTNFFVFQYYIPRESESEAGEMFKFVCDTRGPYTHIGKEELEDGFLPDLYQLSRSRGTIEANADGSKVTGAGDCYLTYLFGPAWRVFIDRLPPAGKREWGDTRKFHVLSSQVVEPGSPEDIEVLDITV